MKAQQKIKITAVATAAVAAVAGAVFLYGTEAGKKKRKQIKSWTLKAKGEVLEKLEKAKEVNEQVYHDVVNAVAKKYEQVKTIDLNEVAEFATELKKHWKNIKSSLKETPAKKPAKKKSASKKA